MKRTVAVITGTGEVRTEIEEIPPLRNNQVLIRVHASLISPGTEMTMVRSRREKPDEQKTAMGFGYSNAGEVIETRGDCQDLKPGMRVAAIGAGYARHETYSCVPVNLVAALAGTITYAEGAYLCLAATALNSVRRTTVELGEYGAVLGLGIVGNLAAQFYQLSGARVIGWEMLSTRIEIARRCGLSFAVNLSAEDPVKATQAFAAPYGLDFANMAFGGKADDALQKLLACMKRSPDGHQMGRIVMVGGCSATVQGGASMGNVDMRIASRTGPGYHDENYEYGAKYPTALVPFTTQRNLREIVHLLQEKRLHVDSMITHRLPLERVSDAADLLIRKPDAAMGVILEMP